MPDTDLLSLPHWESMNDAQLARAIGQAKRRAVQTFALMTARAAECGALMPLAALELYARHCLLTAKEGSDRLKEWDERRVIDWCSDPRVYHFCTLYDRKYREREGLPSPRPCPALLRLRVGYAYAQVNAVSARLVRNGIAAALAPEEYRPQTLFALSQTQTLLSATLKMAILVTLQLNAAMDEFLTR